MMMWILALLAATIPVANDKAARWDFENDIVGQSPKGWTIAQTGAGKGSVWKVAEDPTAPKGAKVLVQSAESPGPMFNLCIADETRFQDGTLTVSFKSLKGDGDQGGGIVWRYQDANNYYVVRYNPLEDNYRLYHVVGGKRTQLASKEKLKVSPDQWHTLKIEMRGESILCYLDGKLEIEASNNTITKPGKVGLWTKADAQTAFDDFQVAPAGK